MTVALERVVGRRRAYERAAKALAAETERTFPIGTRVAVTLGGARIVAEVEGAGGCWWSRPDYLIARNIRTGKLRHFSATCESNEVLILSTPNDSLTGGYAAPAENSDAKD